MAFVEGETLRYFVSEDGDQVTQVAQMVNPGLDVRDVLQLGNVLAHALRLNGDKPKRQPRAAPPELPPERPRRGRPPAGVGLLYNVTVEDIIGYVRKHPGSRPSEIAAALMPRLASKPRNQTIGNRLRAYFDKCERAGTAPAVRTVREGAASRIYPVDGGT